MNSMLNSSLRKSICLSSESAGKPVQRKLCNVSTNHKRAPHSKLQLVEKLILDCRHFRCTVFPSDWRTGKSFSEALILASTNPQYDKGLFIEFTPIADHCGWRVYSNSGDFRTF